MYTKKITLTALALLVTGLVAQAQLDPNRTTGTRIADLLAQVPAENADEIAKNAQEVADLGLDGIVELASGLQSPAKANNATIEYALGGFTSVAAKPGNEKLRELAVNAYSKALGQANNHHAKQFLIRQLRLIGTEAAVPALAAFLNDETLADPAARALAQIATPSAEKAMLAALKNSDARVQLTLVEALGDMKSGAALEAITALASSSDADLQRVVYHSLAKIANPSSADLLAEAAEKANYDYSRNNATSAYLLYLENLSNNGSTALAAKLAKKLLKNAEKADQVHTRTAALTILDELNQSNLKLLGKAVKSDNPEYRWAALKLAEQSKGNASTLFWAKLAKKASPAAKADVMEMLGRTKAEKALPLVLENLNSGSLPVKLAAIKAAGQIGGVKALPNLLKLMNNGDATTIEAVKNAIFTLKGDGVNDLVAAALPKMPSAAKVALLQVLAKRAASGNSAVVLDALKSDDESVQKAAYAALENVSEPVSLPALFALLSSVKGENKIKAVQDAITSALRNGDSQSKTQTLLGQMDKSSASQRYLRILAGIGGKTAFKAIADNLKSNSSDNKKAAMEALASWRDVSAANELLEATKKIENAEYFDKALQTYVSLVNKSDKPDAQKLLMLREAMSVAKTAKQKQQILQGVGNTHTFTSLIFAGEYLDNKELQQSAAMAIQNIALDNKSFNGKIIRDLLEKVMKVLSGRDADYIKKAIQKHLSEMPKEGGFVSLFNGEDLSEWKGLVANPIERAKMSETELAKAQEKANAEMRKGWFVRDGELVFSGHGNNIATLKKYGDFEMYVDWMIKPEGDAGIYLRGTPQVQIWDTSRVDVGAQVGSGGLYNNQKYESKPLVLADNAIGDWNTFHIIMKGEKVTVYLNGQLVTDAVTMENYWDRSKAIFAKEQIELQAHGNEVAYRDIYIREIPGNEPFELSAEEKAAGFTVLFDGTNLDSWTGNKEGYVIENGNIVIHPDKGNGNLFTKNEYGDFVYRFEFQLTPGANNGLGIRAPLKGDAAYDGMELQILDNTADVYKDLHVYQYHGSIYGVIAAKRGALKPVGEWNYEEVIVEGDHIKVIVNGKVIVDASIADAKKNGTLDKRDHPGLYRKTGHIGFLGHGSVVRFRNIRVKEL